MANATSSETTLSEQMACSNLEESGNTPGIPSDETSAPKVHGIPEAVHIQAESLTREAKERVPNISRQKSSESQTCSIERDISHPAWRGGTKCSVDGSASEGQPEYSVTQVAMKVPVVESESGIQYSVRSAVSPATKKPSPGGDTERTAVRSPPGRATDRPHDLLLLDVAPLSLGVQSVGGMFVPVIHRNTTIPTRKSRIFTTASDRQSQVEVIVYEGERATAFHNHLLAQFVLDGIPPAARGVVRVEVTFDIDANGVLQVTALDLGTTRRKHITVGPSEFLSSQEVNNMVQVAEKHADYDRELVAAAENWISDIQGKIYLLEPGRTGQAAICGTREDSIRDIGCVSGSEMSNLWTRVTLPSKSLHKDNLSQLVMLQKGGYWWADPTLETLIGVSFTACRTLLNEGGLPSLGVVAEEEVMCFIVTLLTLLSVLSTLVDMQPVTRLLSTQHVVLRNIKAIWQTQGNEMVKVTVCTGDVDIIQFTVDETVANSIKSAIKWLHHMDNKYPLIERLLDLSINRIHILLDMLLALA